MCWNSDEFLLTTVPLQLICGHGPAALYLCTGLASTPWSSIGLHVAASPEMCRDQRQGRRGQASPLHTGCCPALLRLLGVALLSVPVCVFLVPRGDHSPCQPPRPALSMWPETVSPCCQLERVDQCLSAKAPTFGSGQTDLTSSTCVCWSSWMQSSKRGRDWTFPAPAKIEDVEYLLLQSKKGGNQQAGLMSSDTCPLSFVACLSCSELPRFFPGFLVPFVVLHRFRGFQRLEPTTACVSLSHVLLQAIRRTAHCQFNRV